MLIRWKGIRGEVQKYHNIYVVYTKEAETADQYIEKTVHEIGRKYHVTVATSDALEQVIIMGPGSGQTFCQKPSGRDPDDEPGDPEPLSGKNKEKRQLSF